MLMIVLGAFLAGVSSSEALASPYLGNQVLGPPSYVYGDASPWPYQFPDTTNGKLYFKINPGDTTYATCSAAVLSTAGKNILITAGHCLNDGGSSGGIGHWHSDFYYYPAYNSLNSSDYHYQFPFGYFRPYTVGVTYSWGYFSNSHDDVGFLAMSPQSNDFYTPYPGWKVQDLTGSLGWVFNGDNTVQRSFILTGYASNFHSGKNINFCQGNTAYLDNWGIAAANDGSQYGIGCNMAEGSSGGPWRTSDSGQVWSVNAFGITTYPNVMWGPYLGQEALDSFNSVQPH